MGIREHEGVFQVKQYSALFPNDFISAALEDAPGGVSIVVDGKAPNGVPHSIRMKLKLFILFE